MINLSMAEPDNMLRPRITVVGVGGGGGNAINNMIRSNLDGCDFVVANTDAQALAQSLAARKIQLGTGLSRGLGAGSKPDIGCAAAEESLSDILSILEGSDMLFITAGMGGGTGTGAAPVIAKAARETGILTVGVVTKPFHFEGTQRMRQADRGIAELQKYVDTLIVIPNQNLFRIANERTTFAEAFRMADEVLHSGVRGITDLMVMPGFMNLDFADVKTVMGEMGKAMMGTGESEGDNRAIRAAEAAISNPLLDDISMKGARGVLINITGGLDMTLFEVDQAANRIREEVDPEAQIKVGSTLGDNMDGRIRVSVIATGIDVEQHQQATGQRGQGSIRNETTTVSPTQQSNKVTARLVPQQEAPKSTAAPQNKTAQPVKPTIAETETSTVTATTTNPISGSFFTMPSSIAPKAVVKTAIPATPVARKVQEEEKDQPAEVKVVTTQDSQSTITKSVDPLSDATPPAQTEEPTLVEVATENTPQQKRIQPTTSLSPVREIMPVQQAQRQRSAPATQQNTRTETPDLRVTQLTTQNGTTPIGASTPINQRAQSLFQRITGFGLIRPSAAAKELEDELDIQDEQPKEVQPTIQRDTNDHVAGGADSDLLDIPAFLRRQSNH